MILYFYSIPSCLQLLGYIEKFGTLLSFCIFEHKCLMCRTYSTFLSLHLSHTRLFTQIKIVDQHWFLSGIKCISRSHYPTCYASVGSLRSSWLSPCRFVDFIKFSLKTVIIESEVIVHPQQIFLSLFHHIDFI